MKKHSPLLFLSFFLTTALTFALITIPSYIYWTKGQSLKMAILFGGSGAVLFGLIYATYKLRTLYESTVDLDFSGMAVNPEDRVCKELRRLGYREQDGMVYFAGFRADYYMAPDIRLSREEDHLRIVGPKFYLSKLFKRHMRFRRAYLKKIGQLTDTGADPKRVS